MVRPALEIGKPAICVKQDKGKVFNIGDATWVNVLVDVPVNAAGKLQNFAMVQTKTGGFIYLPSKFFRGLTPEEASAYEAQLEELSKDDSAN